MLVQNGMAYKPEKTILAVGSREEVAPELLSKHGQRRCPRSRAGRIKPREVCFVPPAPPGNTRGMVFRSVQSSGVITDGQSIHLGSLCTVLSLDYRSGTAL